MEETEKRLGAVLLSGAAIISIDNCTRDLSGELLCQLTERSLIKIRVLGRSEMPECECHTTVFATGNNVLFKGDMVRRGLTCNLDVLDERPELREFRHDPLRRVLADRGTYVAAALTIVRAYLAAGAPQKCSALGSYAEWSRMVRSPLVWLGEPDPVESMDSAETRTRSLVIFASCSGCGRTIRPRPEGHDWADHRTGLSGTGGQRLQSAAAQGAAARGGGRSLRWSWRNSAKRLGWWLRGINGRVEAGHRLSMDRLDKSRACFWLTKV